ncbi:MAG: arylsulfatase A-like enzyme [Cognaticolwellia sp.]|jgi:arylsulfatase A-like enzyme
MLILSLLACGGCAEPVLVQEPEQQFPAPAEHPGLILVLTLDTTRADALGVYGGPEQSSPNLDALAEQGLRFDWALAHTATTLSSHSSLWSGLDPHGHGVPRNGFVLDPELPTVPEQLQTAGWDTLAVIGASAVDTSTNLQSGFRLYDEELPNERGRRFEAPGDQVTARALALVERRDPTRPLLLWVHYYDAHSPYEAPEGWDAPFVDPDFVPDWEGDGMGAVAIGFRDRDGTAAEREHLRAKYQGEVRYMDHNIGALLEGLRAEGLMERGWVVVTADHGEMFYEERIRPVGHGADVDLPITHIPMFIVGLGEHAITPGVSEQVVAVSDLAPTILGLANQPQALGQGRDLSPLFTGEAIEDVPIFLEATRPESLGPGWNNLTAERGVVTQGKLLLRAPWVGSSGLYTLDWEQARIVDQASSEGMLSQLEAWDEAAPPFVEENMSPSVREALQALGYLDE